MVVTLDEAVKEVVSLRIYDLVCYHDECLCSCPSHEDLQYGELLEQVAGLTDDGQVPPHNREDLDM